MQNHSHSKMSLQKRLLDVTQEPLPQDAAISKAATTLHNILPAKGIGEQSLSEHLQDEVAPGLNGSSLSPRYYGFVTGGVTPAAHVAERLVMLFDQNVAVHLPNETIATVVEDRALTMLLQLFDLDPQQWSARSFTTGATASNVQGLACGREFIVTEKLARMSLERREGEGVLEACRRADIDKFQILTTMPHSSLGKAANIVGVGSASMKDVSKEGHFLTFDVEKLESYLANPRTASIVVISCGEVNTGAFATSSKEEVKVIRGLCDNYGAWLHVDGGKYKCQP